MQTPGVDLNDDVSVFNESMLALMLTMTMMMMLMMMEMMVYLLMITTVAVHTNANTDSTYLLVACLYVCGSILIKSYS